MDIDFFRILEGQPEQMPRGELSSWEGLVRLLCSCESNHLSWQVVENIKKRLSK